MTLKRIDNPENGWDTAPCAHPEHNPPGHVVLQPGVYEHTCPACQRKIRFRVRPRFYL